MPNRLVEGLWKTVIVIMFLGAGLTLLGGMIDAIEELLKHW